MGSCPDTVIDSDIFPYANVPYRVYSEFSLPDLHRLAPIDEPPLPN